MSYCDEAAEDATKRNTQADAQRKAVPAQDAPTVPVLGLTPSHVIEYRRVLEICHAVARFDAEGKGVPRAWLVELAARLAAPGVLR